MVAESSLVQAKVGEHVKQQVGDDLLRKMEGLEYRLEGCEGEMQGLGQAISARFKKLEDKVRHMVHCPC
jgi:chaperonin cofactor prefoldin